MEGDMAVFNQLSARVCGYGCLPMNLRATNRGLSIAAWLALAAPAPAWADSLQLSAGLLSDKVVYGNSQSAGRTSAVFDTVFRTHTGWTLSTGLASLGGAAVGRPDAEITLGLSRGGALGADDAWQASYTRNDTVGPADRRRPGYHQVGMGYAWAERLQLSATANVGLAGPARGGGRTRGTAAIVEAGWHQPLGQRWALDAGLGHVAYDRVAFANYHFGSVGLSWGLGPVQVFAGRVFSTSRSPNAVGPRPVLSVLWNL
jgi:hypothetical protein